MRTDAEVLDGRYRLTDRLGRGGAADVFVADDLRLGRPVAVKRYRSARYGVGLRRFMVEAELHAGLSHPGLLKVFDVCFDGERPFLVLQYAAGGSLRDRLDSGPLRPDRVAALGADLADVLSYVHTNGIVHRDIKPSNVLFNSEGDCYLADFGIARALGAAHLTASNEFIGTAAYLAPEQVLDRDPGTPADVYALGLLLLECLTGAPEYAGSDVEMAVARLNRPPRIAVRWGHEWRAVLSAMTAADPADRPDAARCAELLRAVGSGQTKVFAVPVRRAKTRALAGVAALAVLVAAGAASAAGPTTTTGRPESDPSQVVPATQQAPQTAQSGASQTEAPPTEAPNAVAPAAEKPPPAPPGGKSGKGGGPKGEEHDNSGPGRSEND